MEAFKITMLLLPLCMAHIPSVLTGDTIYGKVGEKIVLKCPSEPKDTFLEWARGSYSSEIPVNGSYRIYRGKIGKEPTKGDMRRPDMVLDINTFTLTLVVQKDEADNGFFTCVTEGNDKEYDVTKVLVFLQPHVSITTDPKQSEAGINVTVTCTIERLYPNITSDQFDMMWGTSSAPESEFSAVMNDDGSIKYTLEKTKTLTWDDNGLNVKCTVKPKANFGDPASGNITLAFSKTPPTDSGPSTDGKSNTAAIVGGVIGGLAVVGLVALIVVIVLGRKKPKKDTKTRQSEVRGTKTTTNKPVSEGLMYADLDLVAQSVRSTGRQESHPPTTHRPVQEPTEYAQIDFDKLKRKMSRDEEDLDLSDVEDSKKTTG